MLERAARCLDSRAPGSWTFRKNASRARRQLHSAFWRHGAADLNLPLYVFESITRLFEPSNFGRKCDRRSLSPGCHDFPLLDFLYPPETRALLRQWTRTSRRQTPSTGAARRSPQAPRPYTSIATPGGAAFASNIPDKGERRRQPAVDGLDLIDERSRLVALLHRPNQSFSVELADAAWQAYIGLESFHDQEELRSPLLLFLSRSSRVIDAERVNHLFDATPKHSRDGPVIFAAMDASMLAGDYQRAFNVHQTLTDAHMTLDSSSPAEAAGFKPTGRLLTHLISCRDWENAVQCWSLRRLIHVRRGAFSAHWYRFSKRLSDRLAEKSDVQDDVNHFLDNLTARPESFETPALRSFVDMIVAAAFESKHQRAQRMHMLAKLAELRFTRASYLDQTCVGILEERAPLNDKVEAALRCYLMLREQGFDPRRRLLQSFLHWSVEADNSELVAFFAGEWRSFYGELNTDMALRLMRLHSRRADIQSTEQILNELLRLKPPERLGVFYPILHAEALCNGPEATAERIRWITETYGYPLDLTCWNILLNAHAKHGDLDGALETVEKIQRAGLSLDQHSIGTMLSVCADRGAVGLALDYLRLARRTGVKTTPRMLDSLVLAYLNDGNDFAASRLAERVAQKAPSTTTHMWALILAHLATARRTDRALEHFARIKELGVPFDGEVYGALMRVLTVARAPSAALRVMSHLMPAAKVPYSELHYAILMSGFADVGRFENAYRLYADMLHGGKQINVQASQSTRLALMRVQSLAVMQQMRLDNAAHPAVRAELLEELLQECLDESALVSPQGGPRLLTGRRAASPLQLDVYFDTVFSVYGMTRSLESMKRILALLGERTSPMSSEGSRPRSLSLLFGMMRMRYIGRDFDAVGKLWDMALEAAQRQGHQPQGRTDTGSRAHASESGATRPFLAVAWRQSLARHLDVRLRALAQQDALPEIRATLESYAGAGFGLDSGNWCMYIEILCAHGYYLRAFSVAERHLMRGFRGFPQPSISPIAAQANPSIRAVGHTRAWVRSGNRFMMRRTMDRLARAIAQLEGPLPRVGRQALDDDPAHDEPSPEGARDEGLAELEEYDEEEQEEEEEEEDENEEQENKKQEHEESMSHEDLHKEGEEAATAESTADERHALLEQIKQTAPRASGAARYVGQYRRSARI